MTPSDIEAVAEAKCLLLLLRLPLLAIAGSSAACSSNVHDGFHCSALAALVLNGILSAVDWPLDVAKECSLLCSALLDWLQLLLTRNQIPVSLFSSLLSTRSDMREGQI